MKNYKDIVEANIAEEFDEKKAIIALKGIQQAFAAAKYVGLHKSAIKQWDDAYYSTYTRWFSSKDMDKMRLPTKLK